MNSGGRNTSNGGGFSALAVMAISADDTQFGFLAGMLPRDLHSPVSDNMRVARAVTTNLRTVKQQQQQPSHRPTTPKNASDKMKPTGAESLVVIHPLEVRIVPEVKLKDHQPVHPLGMEGPEVIGLLQVMAAGVENERKMVLQFEHLEDQLGHQGPLQAATKLMVLILRGTLLPTSLLLVVKKTTDHINKETVHLVCQLEPVTKVTLPVKQGKAQAQLISRA
jgi:hypothetical protein